MEDDKPSDVGYVSRSRLEIRVRLETALRLVAVVSTVQSMLDQRRPPFPIVDVGSRDITSHLETIFGAISDANGFNGTSGGFKNTRFPVELTKRVQSAPGSHIYLIDFGLRTTGSPTLARVIAEPVGGTATT